MFTRYLLIILAALTLPASADDWFYLRDDSNCLKLSSTATGYDLELSAYDEGTESDVFYQTLESSKTNQWKVNVTRDEKPLGALEIKGAVGGPKLEVTITELAFPNGDKIKGTGHYRLVSPKEWLAASRRRANKTDKLLNTIYAKVKEEVGKSGFSTLRDTQREWLAHRDYLLEGPGIEKNSAEYWDRLTSLTAERCEFLQFYSGKNVPPGRSGIYRDGYGGELQLDETEARIVFSISVVRGPTYHLGDIEGIAKPEGNQAHYLEKLEAEGDLKPAEIKLKFLDSHRVDVSEKNTDAYHGLRAFFRGLYYKTGNLKEPLRLGEPE